MISSSEFPALSRHSGLANRSELVQSENQRVNHKMTYRFLVDTYETERLKVLSVWTMFDAKDLIFRPHPADPRGRSVREQMVHQCVSEDLWFRTILGIDVGAPPLPDSETPGEFIERYAIDSGARLDLLREKDDAWWEEIVQFFEVPRGRTWVMVRRHLAHLASPRPADGNAPNARPRPA